MSTVTTLTLTHKSASCTVALWGDGTASISNVYSEQKRKGHARELMNKVMAYADKEHLLLKTAAEPYGEEPRIPIEKLTEFYVSFGFTVLGDDPEYVFMEREPIK